MMRMEPGKPVVCSTAVTNQATLFRRIRAESLARCEPLETDDYQLQPIADVSPAKWHLAHTSWFFETFILVPYCPDYKRFHESYEVLFNSYYEGVGQAWERAKRGDLSRPTVNEILAYRTHVDSHILALLNDSQIDQTDIQRLITLGLHHEHQHQELLLTDIKYCFALNPLQPTYKHQPQACHTLADSTLDWLYVDGGTIKIGTNRSTTGTYEDFVFDNETPVHKVHLEPYRIASRLITNGEFLAFIEDGGYRRPELWLADGWALVQSENWCCPLYWQGPNTSAYSEYNLSGAAPLNERAPVSHISLYEAYAYALWKGARLPTEAEWEHSALSHACLPRDASGCFDTQVDEGGAPKQMFDCLWQWTASSYNPYPGFKPFAGAIGEYNGKFMCAQHVLRGSSIATPKGHARTTYRNFFYPKDRWQFTGIRLAKDA